MDLAAITAFVTVGDTGGFRAAADALGVTSGGISKAISRLELQVGVTLLARTTRSVRLTSAGKVFHARCKSILADLEEASREVTDRSALPQGRLVVSASRAFGRLCVIPIVTDYLRQHPQVEIEVRLSDRPVDLVSEGVDLAVRIGHLPDSSLIATRVSQTSFVMCGSPEYLALNGLPRHPDDLKNHDVVGYVTPDTAVRFTYHFQIDGLARAINLSSRLTVDDGEAAVGAAVRSAGLVMVNGYHVAPHLADGKLVRILREFEVPPVPISVVHSPTRLTLPVTRTFVALLRRRLVASP